MAVRESVSAAGLLESAIGVASAPGSALLLRALLEAVRIRYVGSRVTLRHDDRTLSLVPTAVTSSGIGPWALASGRIDEVRVEARDVDGPGLRLREVAATAEAVRLRPGLAPALCAGPVEIEAVLDPEWIARRLAERVPGLDVDVGADGMARARWRSRPGLGSAELAVAAEGHSVSWRVVALTVAGRRVEASPNAERRRTVRAILDRSPLRAARSGSVELPGLPPGLRLHGIELAPGRVTVRGRLETWAQSLSAAWF